jgi:hypothetical protein
MLNRNMLLIRKKPKSQTFVIDFREWPNQYITLREDWRSPVYNSEGITTNTTWRSTLRFSISYGRLPAGKKIHKVEYLNKYTQNYVYSWDWYDSFVTIDLSKTIVNIEGTGTIWTNGITYNNVKRILSSNNNNNWWNTSIPLNQRLNTVVDFENDTASLYRDFETTPSDVFSWWYQWESIEQEGLIAGVGNSVVQSIKFHYK